MNLLERKTFLICLTVCSLIINHTLYMINSFSFSFSISFFSLYRYSISLSLSLLYSISFFSPVKQVAIRKNRLVRAIEATLIIHKRYLSILLFFPIYYIIKYHFSLLISFLIIDIVSHY
jgi:hypothetical protein